jgi:methionyl aminopeptidase
MDHKLKIMTEGGLRLARIKQSLLDMAKPGIAPLDIDTRANDLITAGGDYPSFKTVSGYKHATCININSGVVHGIPSNTPLASGDVVKIDLGLMHHDYHLDTSSTIVVGQSDPAKDQFLAIGLASLNAAIEKAHPGHSVFDISQAMEETLLAGGLTPIRDLTGHGIGRKLHMDPYIPCFANPQDKRHVLKVGDTIAIEVMYTNGGHHLVEDSDGWTLSTQDGSLAGMFEDTVYISQSGPLILTRVK